MPASLIYYPILTFRDVNDVPLPFARVHSYLASTTTPSSLFTTAAGTTPLPNPAICDAGGRLTAYGLIGTAYKLDVFDQNNVHVPGFPVDNLVITPNGDPSLIAGYDSVAEMSLTLDPGEVGTEVVPTTLQQWMQQVQFLLKERGQVNRWYESYALRFEQGMGWIGDAATTVSGIFPPTGTTTQQWTLRIPDGWRPQTDMTWVATRNMPSVGGTAIMFFAVFRQREGQVQANIVGLTAAAFAPGSTASFEMSVTIPGSALFAGDTLVLYLQRLGDDAGDTAAANVVVSSNVVFYTGLAGS